MTDAYALPRGPQAARLRKRKADLLRLHPMPDDLLPGSLSESHMRCGKPGCHCAQPGDPGHSFWTLTYMRQAKKRTLHIPKDLVDEVKQLLRLQLLVVRELGLRIYLAALKPAS